MGKDYKHTNNLTVTTDSEMSTAAALADSFANPTAGGTAAFGMIFNGTTWDRSRGDATNGMLVNLGTNNDVTVSNAAGSGVYVRQGTSEIFEMNGVVAHDAADAGNPVKVGYKAIAHGANPTAVAAGDVTDAYSNRAGIPFVIGGHPNVLTLHDENTNAGADEVLQAINAGQKFVITSISVFVDVECTVDAVAAWVELGSTTKFKHPGIAVGSGWTVGDGSGILAIGADGEDLTWTNEVATGGSVTCTVTGYLIES